MSTISLNAELLRQLSYIADDEFYLEKALKSIKRLVAQKGKEESSCVAEEDAEYRPLTKTELLTDLDEAFKDAKLAQEGKLQGQPLEEFLGQPLEEFLHELHH